MGWWKYLSGWLSNSNNNSNNYKIIIKNTNNKSFFLLTGYFEWSEVIFQSKGLVNSSLGFGEANQV